MCAKRKATELCILTCASRKSTGLCIVPQRNRQGIVSLIRATKQTSEGSMVIATTMVKQDIGK